MKIIAVIVTYNPIEEDLFRNIEFILPQVDKLVIFDNASSNSKSLRLLNKHSNIEIIFSSENIGLGAAYNKIIESNYKDFDYLITLDQDTQVPMNLVNNLLCLFSKNDIGIVGPSFEKRGQKYIPFEEVDVLIQSACVFKMKLFDKVGLFNAEYFIDSIDFEFCLRAKLMGYKILRSNYDYINHNLGVRKTFLFINYTSHNSIRNFYISRNHVDLSFRFFRHFPFFIIKKNIFFIMHIIKIILFERDLVLLRSIIKGFRNYKII
jgi:rhamnosyltransferase